MSKIKMESVQVVVPLSFYDPPSSPSIYYKYVLSPMLLPSIFLSITLLNPFFLLGQLASLQGYRQTAQVILEYIRPTNSPNV